MVSEPSVGDVEGGGPVAEGLVDDQGAVGDHAAVREVEVLGDRRGRAVQVDPRQGGGGQVGTVHQVEPEVAEPGAPLGVDHHVVGVAGHVVREVGVRDQRAVVLAPQELRIVLGDDQQASVGEPAEPRGLARDLRLDAQVAAVERDGVDLLEVEVGEEQPVVVPPRALREVQVLDDGPQLV